MSVAKVDRLEGGRFAPGNLANPSGRPKGAAGLARVAREIAGEDGRLMLQVLADIALDERAKNSDRIAASTELLNRGFGRPMQAVDISIDDGNGGARVLNLDTLSPADLMAYVQVFEKVIAGGAGPLELPPGQTVPANTEPPTE